MEPTVASLGGSVLVPSVQELAREPLISVPPRYVRDDQDPPIISDATCLPELPVIDMQSLVSQDTVELQKLDLACKQWGFFQLVNHGVSNSLVEKVKSEIQEFFRLPMEEKKKFWQEPGDLEGFGQAFVLSEEQKLDWADMFYVQTLPTHLRKPHLFPKLPLPLRDTLEAYSKKMKNVAIDILYQMATALKMDSKDITDLFEEGMQGMRMNYYPPCPQPDLVIGLTPHSDTFGLTILLEVNEMEGLQIRKDGEWIPVKPLPNAFVVNIGDVMEMVTNGAYRSIEHRAVINAVKERLSIATFYGPRLDGELGPAPSLITPESPPLFKRMGVVDYLRGFFARELNGKSYLEVMRIKTGVDKNN